MKSFFKKWKFPLTILGLALVLFSASVLSMVYAELLVDACASQKMSEKVEFLPPAKAALLLGTTRQLKSGALNPYYENRIQRATELCESGHIEKLVISGDHSRKDYNEPQDMMDDLIARGVPADMIVLDYAGRDTYDSVHRMARIFEQNQFIVVSQQFHVERALTIADCAGLDCYGLVAKDVSARFGWKVRLRESFARLKMLWDIYTKRDPYFLGETIALD